MLSGSGVLSIVKSGSGSWSLSNANSYSGLSTVSVGTLAISHSSALGSVTSGTAVSSGATLWLQGT